MTSAEAVLEALTNLSLGPSASRALRENLLAFGSATDDNKAATQELTFKNHTIYLGKSELKGILWAIEDGLTDPVQQNAIRIALLLISALETRHKERAES